MQAARPHPEVRTRPVGPRPAYVSSGQGAAAYRSYGSSQFSVEPLARVSGSALMPRMEVSHGLVHTAGL